MIPKPKCVIKNPKAVMNNLSNKMKGHAHQIIIREKLGALEIILLLFFFFQ